jgi:N-acetylmuramoyl-L-alanine amidase
MKIVRHRLFYDDGAQVPYVRSANISGKVTHEYLVIHYTAGRTLEGAVSWLTNRSSRASAHVIIGREGQLVQLVPFDRMAWHAGASAWEGRIGLNRYALGIELDNAGCLVRQHNRWRAWFGYQYEDVDVIEAQHKHGRRNYGWHVYTEKQIEVALEVSQLLVTRYGLYDVIGHVDISPRRK